MRRRRNLRRVPTTEEKPEVPFSRVLKRDPRLVFGTTFERFCDWYRTFSCPKHGPGRARDRPDFVCLSDVCYFFLSAPFSSRSVDVRLCFQKKSLKKRGPAPYETPRWTVFWLRSDPADPRSLALSSSCASGATCPAGSF